MVTKEAVFTSLIRQCSVSRSLVEGRQVHEAILKSGYQQNTFLGNLLIQMYASCGQLQDCRRVFQGLPHKNVFSWNLLLSAYSTNGLTSQAWSTFLSMQRRDHVSWSSILGALTATDRSTALLVFERSPCRGLLSYTALLSVVEPEQAKQLFDQMPQRDSISWNAMAAALFQHKDFESAQTVFRRTPEHSVSSCNVALTAYAHSGNMQSAVELFRTMPHRSVVSWTALLQGRFQNSSLELESCMMKMPQHNVAAWNSLLQSFVCKGRLQEAESVFKSIPQPDAASWTLMLTLYAAAGHLSLAVRAFERIFPADVAAYNAMLNAYSIAGFIDQARLFFDRMSARNCLSWNTLLATFANGGLVESAVSVFQRMPQRGFVAWNSMLRSYVIGQPSTDAVDFFWLMMPCRDVLSWTTMLPVFCEPLDLLDFFEQMPKRDLVAWSVVMKAMSQTPGGSRTVLSLFHKMQLEGLAPDSAICSSVVSACFRSGTIKEAMAIHSEMLTGCLDAVTATSLVTLYGKHGWIDGATSVFESLDERDAAAWNAMIAAFAHSGDRRRATELFREMQLEGMDPSGATFTSLFYCWSHVGSISAAFQALASLQSDHAMQLEFDHYVCILDLLARSGKLAEAQDLVTGLDLMDGAAAAWAAFLSACKSHGESTRGTSAGRHLLQLSPESSAPYVLLSQCCTEAGSEHCDGELAGSVRSRGRDRGCLGAQPGLPQPAGSCLHAQPRLHCGSRHQRAHGSSRAGPRLRERHGPLVPPRLRSQGLLPRPGRIRVSRRRASHVSGRHCLQALQSNFATIDDASGVVVSRRADRHFEEEGPILCSALDKLKLPSFPEYEVRVRYATEHRCGVVVKGPGLSGNISGSDPLKDNRPLQTVVGLDDSEETKHTAAVVNELSDVIRKILTAHPLNEKRKSEGKAVANVVLLRGCGIRVKVPVFEDKHHLRACMVAPTKIIAGLGLSLGISCLDAPGATGDYRTLLTSKATAIAKALAAPLQPPPDVFVPGEEGLKPGCSEGYEFGFLHIKAIDDAGHDKSVDMKVSGFEAVDKMIGQLARLLWEAESEGSMKYTLCVTGDHSTPAEYGDHSFEPVPFAICHLKDFVKLKGEDSVLATSLEPFKLKEESDTHSVTEPRHQGPVLGDCVAEFTELAAARGVLGRFPGSEMMGLIKKYLQHDRALTMFQVFV